MLNSLFNVIFILLGVMVSVAFMTLLERKVLSLVGMRVGPNKVSLSGFLQPISDAVKLSNKQVSILMNSSYLFFYMSCCLILLLTFLFWILFFCSPSFVSFKFGFIFLMIFLGLNSLMLIISGWSTFSKYSLLGILRSVSQLVSYEACLYLCFFCLLLMSQSFSFSALSFFGLPLMSFTCPCLFYIWFPSFLAELNRTPYDFSEGESELVSGFNIEFGSFPFTLVFLAEYGNILFFCMLTSILFFNSSFFFFFFLFSFFVIWIRSVLPRYRYDKLMMLAWKFFIPFLTLLFFFVCLSVLFYFL